MCANGENVLARQQAVLRQLGNFFWTAHTIIET